MKNALMFGEQQQHMKNSSTLIEGNSHTPHAETFYFDEQSHEKEGLLAVVMFFGTCTPLDGSTGQDDHRRNLGPCT
jgi:hypothetical protein